MKQSLFWGLTFILLSNINYLSALSLKETKKLSEKTYVVHGKKGVTGNINTGISNNPAFIMTHDGVVVIDPGSSYLIGKLLIKKIKTMTNKPITHIFNTHIHGDHWLGNHAIAEKYPSVKIIAHPELIKLLKNGHDKIWLNIFKKRIGKSFEGTKAYFPNIEASDGKDYKIGGMTFRVYLYEKAHTTTDMMVHVIEEDVVFTGDIVNDRHLSFMGHGNFKGAIDACKKALSINAKHYVPGHGFTGEIGIVKTYLGYYESLFSEVKKHYEDGLMGYQMKPLIVKKFSKYKDWHHFQKYIGLHINQALLEVEMEEMN